jgi:hypothetical protein
VIIPESVTFEQAIALTQSLLSQMEAGKLSQPEIMQAIAQLVKTGNGARGFFVTYLTSKGTVADNPSAEVIQALQASADTVAELLVKNLAMSAAMAVTHRRNGDEANAQESDRVRSRTTRLIEQVELPQVYKLALALQESAVTGTGTYGSFLQTWGYDTEQRQIIGQALQQVIRQVD